MIELHSICKIIIVIRVNICRLLIPYQAVRGQGFLYTLSDLNFIITCSSDCHFTTDREVDTQRLNNLHQLKKAGWACWVVRVPLISATLCCLPSPVFDDPSRRHIVP